MKQRSLGAGSVALVAALSLVFGFLGGLIAAHNSTRTVTQVVSSGDGGTVPVALSTAPMSWAQVVQKEGPAVVTIINHQQQQQGFFGPVPGAVEEGSGFIIDDHGDIVTNEHVIDQAQSLQVVFADGRKTGAQLVRADPLTDLAVIRVRASVPAVLHFGDSAHLLPGDPVLAIGSALGQYRNSVTSGVVSGLGRTVNEPAGIGLHDMIQTDAAINQGNSGGPLLDDQGDVIGVNTVIQRGSAQTSLFGADNSVVAEGLGFAIPSATVKNVVARLVENKPPAYFGVSYHQITAQESAFYNLPVGAYVNGVAAGSPAARAGIQQHDVIIQIAGVPLNDTDRLEQVVTEHAPGDTIKVQLWRAGRFMTVSVKLTAKGSSS